MSSSYSTDLTLFKTKVRIAPPSPQKKPPPFPGNNVPSRIHAPRTPGAVRRSLFYCVTCQLNQSRVFVQKVSPHRPIAEPAQARPHTLGASPARWNSTRTSIAHQTDRGLPRPPGRPRTLNFNLQARDPTTTKDTHVSPSTALAAER